MTLGDAVAGIVCEVLRGSRKATAYLTPTMTVKGTMRKSTRFSKRQQEILVTVGKPNYAEREFIRVAKLAGEAFPIKRIQIKSWPRTQK